MTPVTTATVPAPSEPTHPCARCGDPVGPGIGLCERCNPLGLRDSSASQAHGTAFIGVAFAVIALAIVARLAFAGVGPFPATVDAVEPAVAGVGVMGLAVTLTVTNEGDATGQTTCRLTDPTDRGISTSALVLSPRIDAGETVTFTSTVTEFGSTPLVLQVECRTP